MPALCSRRAHAWRPELSVGNARSPSTGRPELMKLYTTVEAAEILRVKPSWLEWQAARKIPFTMLGGAYRFTAAHLAAIVAMNENPPRSRRADSDRQTRRQARREPAIAGAPAVAPLRPRPRTGARHARIADESVA